jgi:hypothetical protein
MARVKTGIGRTKRDLLKKIAKLTKFAVGKTRKGEFLARDKVVFAKAILDMTKAYKLLHKIPCIQVEMSIPYGHYGGARRGSRKARRAR